MKDINFLKNKLFARRGLYDNIRIYENTISAFSRALKYNFPIEMEVRLLSDGTIIVFHDDNAKRLLHIDDNIDNMTYDELCYLSKYQIPKFEDVLNLIKGEVPILIELKTVTRKYLLENKICEYLDKYNGKFAVQSFYIKTVKWFYKNRKDYVVGYMIGWKNINKDIWFKKYDFLNIKINSYKDKKIRVLKENKVVLGWRVNTKEELSSSEHLYDGLIVDNLLEILDH